MNLLLRSIAVVAAAQFTLGETAPQAKTTNGTLIGLHNTFYNQDIFLGIPYAIPPVGDLRFRVPASYNRTYKNFKVTQYSPSCVGYGGDDIGYVTAEDCLTLNIIRPTLATAPENLRLPVAVWIHDGGYAMGGSGDRRYNLSFIVNASAEASQPMIGVSINYRLNAFGFLTGREVLGSGNANIGLRDQRLALHWIQDNIAAFGGDPSRVTIWGESAGASSVGNQLIAYGGRDDKLFRGAIMESGGPIAYSPMLFGEQKPYDALVNATGCVGEPDSLQCLRGLSFEALNAVLNTTAFNGSDFSFSSPVVDGDFIPYYPSQLLEQGKFVKVPIICGANSDEGTAFTPLGINNNTDFTKYLQGLSKDYSSYPLSTKIVNTILQDYPDNPTLGIPVDTGSTRYPFLGLQFKRAAAFAGDFVFIGPRRQAVLTWAKYSVPSYSYRFNTIPNGVPRYIGATHFQEVAFVFRNFDGLGYAENPFQGEGESYVKLSEYMSSKWISFVSNLDPNVGNAEPVWPNYGVGGEQVVFDANRTSYIEKDDFRKAGIAFINSIPLQFSR